MSIRIWAPTLRRLLLRETSSGQLVPEIDGLRFVAIASVLFFHLGGYIGLRAAERFGSAPKLTTPADRALHAVHEVGDFGVQLFFGISGFLLALPFAEADLSGRPRPALRRYFLRRLTRLEPPYIINLAVWYAAQVFVKGGSAVGLIPHFLASVFYIHNIVYAEPSRINQVAWTLEIEVQFYILAPVLTLLFRIDRAMVRRGILLTSLVIVPAVQFGLLPGGSEIIRRSLLWQFQYFLVGFLLADVYLVDWQKNPATDGRWDMLGLAAWAGILGTLLGASEPVRA